MPVKLSNERLTMTKITPLPSVTEGGVEVEAEAEAEDKAEHLKLDEKQILPKVQKKIGNLKTHEVDNFCY